MPRSARLEMVIALRAVAMTRRFREWNSRARACPMPPGEQLSMVNHGGIGNDFWSSNDGVPSNEDCLAIILKLQFILGHLGGY